MMPSDHAHFLATGGFTLGGSGTPIAKQDLGRACRWLRHFVRSDADNVWSQAFSKGHVSWALQHDMGVHSVVGDIQPGHMKGWNAEQFRAHVYDWMNYLSSAGVTQARIEVGNEQNMARADNWLTPTEWQRDVAFNTYIKMYAAASDAMRDFRAEHPELDYQIGGPACSTGGSFAYRVAQWAWEKNHLMDFVSWHWYGLTMSLESLQQDITAIKSNFNLPVILTEVGYDPWSELNHTDEAALCVRNFLINAKELGVDDMLWLTTNSASGLGIWLDNDATQLSKIGEEAIRFIG